MTPTDFIWINKRCVVRGEDFSYEATCLCCFPKSNGKVRYIVEDNGRLFIQRKEQITFFGPTQDIPEKVVPAKLGTGCPICGFRHPPDGMCAGPTIDPLGR